MNSVAATTTLAMATKAHGAPFGNTSAGQGSTFQTWDQAYSAASPMVPMPAPQMAPKVIPRNRLAATRPITSTTSASTR